MFWLQLTWGLKLDGAMYMMLPAACLQNWTRPRAMACHMCGANKTKSTEFIYIIHIQFLHAR
jgi:hypothetical protein